MKSMMDPEFRETLEHFVRQGTPTERELARVALSLYQFCDSNPEVVKYVNQRALEAINRAA